MMATATTAMLGGVRPMSGPMVLHCFKRVVRPNGRGYNAAGWRGRWNRLPIMDYGWEKYG